MIIILRFNYLKKKLTINNNVMYLKKLLSIFLNVLLFDSNIGYTSIPIQNNFIQNNLCDYCGPNTLAEKCFTDYCRIDNTIEPYALKLGCQDVIDMNCDVCFPESKCSINKNNRRIMSEINESETVNIYNKICSTCGVDTDAKYCFNDYCNEDGTIEFHALLSGCKNAINSGCGICFPESPCSNYKLINNKKRKLNTDNLNLFDDKINNLISFMNISFQFDKLSLLLQTGRVDFTFSYDFGNVSEKSIIVVMHKCLYSTCLPIEHRVEQTRLLLQDINSPEILYEWLDIIEKELIKGDEYGTDIPSFGL